MLLSLRVRVICRSSLLALTTSPPLIKYQQTTPPKQGIRRKPFPFICCYLTCSSNNWINSHFYDTHAQRIGCECPILFLTRAKQGTREEALLSHGRTLSRSKHLLLTSIKFLFSFEMLQIMPIFDLFPGSKTTLAAKPPLECTLKA